MTKVSQIICVFMLAALLFIACATPALAIKVTLNGDVVFYDNFESRAVGATFGVPSPSAASWGLNFRDGNTVVVVGGVEPGAAEGDRYGQLTRVVSNRSSFAAAQFGVSVVEGDQLHAEWMMYIPSGNPQFGFNGGFEDVFENRPVAIASSPTGDVMALNEGLFWYDSGIDFEFDTWQKWQHDWTVGSPNMTVTVGEASIVLSNADPGGDAIAQFYLSTVNGSNFYVDAVPALASAHTVVPEPASGSSAFILMVVSIGTFRRKGRLPLSGSENSYRSQVPVSCRQRNS